MGGWISGFTVVVFDRTERGGSRAKAYTLCTMWRLRSSGLLFLFVSVRCRKVSRLCLVGCIVGTLLLLFVVVLSITRISKSVVTGQAAGHFGVEDRPRAKNKNNPKVARV